MGWIFYFMGAALIVIAAAMSDRGTIIASATAITGTVIVVAVGVFGAFHDLEARVTALENRYTAVRMIAVDGKLQPQELQGLEPITTDTEPLEATRVPYKDDGVIRPE